MNHPANLPDSVSDADPEAMWNEVEVEAPDFCEHCRRPLGMYDCDCQEDDDG